jgi:hypothetical protein
MTLLKAIKIEIKVDEYNIDSLYTLICHNVLIKEKMHVRFSFEKWQNLEAL